MEEYVKAEIAKPNPKSTINSYRSFGYNLSTAIADIIDNSISANADEIRLEYKWNGQDSFISISDNGTGMNKEELVMAMTPGSKDPEEIRSEKDLGRFGMGLKTASFSQCKRVSCVTKKGN
jgi:HSP90 family molecular chaperone